MKRTLDELNEIKHKSIPFEQYFGEMELSEDEKEKRIGLARKLEVLFLYAFLMASSENFQLEEFKTTLSNKYINVVKDYMGVEYTPSKISEYVNNIVNEILDTTMANFDDDYYTSNDRATYIAENEANSIGNYVTYTNAIKGGMKYKTWLTMKDRHVRHSHQLVDEEKIEIFDTFHVGDDEMLYPKDSNASAKEIVNCRCVVKYSRN